MGARMLNRFIVLVLALAATTTHASGFYFGDNGAKAMQLGGAFTGQADDLTAIMYNPAGLAGMDGFQFLVDASLLNHDVRYLRQDNGFDPANPSTLVNEVSNTGGLFFLPFLGVSKAFTLADRRLTVALGIYGPPSVGRYQFAEPNYEKKLDANMRLQYVETPRKFAPSRYQLLNNDIIVLYPTLAAGFQVHKRFWVGGSLQYVYSTFKFRQTLYADAGLTRPKRLADEEANYDSEVGVTLEGKPLVTGIVGAMVKPIDSLQIGASLRGQVPLRASGKLNLVLGETAKMINTQVMGDQADLALNFPLEFRLGVHFRPISRLGLNLDYVYLGWQSIGELVLTPQNVTLKVGSAEPKAVEPFHIEKKWHASNSVRFGASFDIIEMLTASAGFMWEQGAAPDERVDIGFAHFDRAFITGGLTAHLWKLDVLAGFAYTPTVTRAVTNSLVTAGRDDPTAPPIFVGAGVYNSGGWSMNFGIHGKFGGDPKPGDSAPAEVPVTPVAPTTAPSPDPGI